MIDAISLGLATVFPQGVLGEMDFVLGSIAYAANADEAVANVTRLLSDENARTQNALEMRGRVNEHLSPSVFVMKLQQAFDSVTRHKVYEVTPYMTDDPDELSCFLYAMTVRRKEKFSFGGVRLASVREGSRKSYELAIGKYNFIF